MKIATSFQKFHLQMMHMMNLKTNVSQQVSRESWSGIIAVPYYLCHFAPPFSELLLILPVFSSLF